MDKIIAVRFKKTGKLVYLNPLKYIFKIGDQVIANTDRGEEIARVVKIIDKDKISKDTNIGRVLRPAGRKEIEKEKKNRELEQEVVKFCKEKVTELKLNMKIILAEYTHDLSKLTIYFTSEERVDFRELVKMLASKYRSRIELRQIGPRDEIKSYPNLGICGREVCCRTFLEDFDSVTIKMAKEQGLQINMPKLSGACGKLMCCLKYEHDLYKENLEKLPKVGSQVTVNGEKAKVASVDILGLKVKVRFGEDDEDLRYETYDVSDIKFKKNKDENKQLSEGSEKDGI